MPARAQYLQIIVVGIIFLCLLAALTVFSYQTFVASRGTLFDFYPHYTGAQVFRDGDTPYSDATTARIQRGMFGGELPPELDQQRFAYPAYSALLLLPLSLLEWSAAISLWMSLQFLLILLSIIVWLQVIGWRPSPLLLPILLLLLVFAFRYPINVYVLGQFTGVTLFCIVCATWALKQRRDLLAGILFALSLNPPTTNLGIALIILAALALTGRRRPLIAFSLTMGLLILVSSLAIGWWLPDFINQVRAYAQYAGSIHALSLFPVGCLLALVIIGVRGVMLFRDGQDGQQKTGDDRFIAEGTALSVIAALLLLPQTGNYFLTLLIMPMLIIL